MPILIGQELENDFSNPLGLLGDCHRRIERFLDGLIAISEKSRGGRLGDAERQEFEVGLRYFREAAPKHTLDEEESLFPRLRERNDAESHVAFAMAYVLHDDHVKAEVKHREVDDLGQKWLANERLTADDNRNLIRLLRELRSTYERHIAVEDKELFPLAARVLSRAELDAIGQEMAQRRGLVISELLPIG